MLTQKQLKEKLHYNPDTGLFRKICKTKWYLPRIEFLGVVDDGGYLIITINKKKHRSHRLAFLYMTGNWPAQIDHINHNRTDNRWVNLRNVTHTENQRNRTINKNNKSGVTGVHKCKSAKKWRAKIKSKGLDIHLGYFDDKFEAICARKSADRRYGYHSNHGQGKSNNTPLA